ncbi:flagellar hook-associated protein 1 FlgK [Rhodovulum imhoffii]|uniref:Flagellar hook-associated protein 1 n=1 Tax=Rhodovulum imhoffii TaxID=365340 RepID=A0A2T5BRP8_9RHOB|nr:flagellar hook-associated protein FlgK [Rhodovulum imhoffii]MBK5934062.1 flagellar hook-associated protein FlgK [Rhodovulum imhoffii]PTN01947.1 flagellar hook-associated protein 1 FlgK [Rhodovulum imhoffii]
MSISSTLNNAMSGLAAASRGTEVISANIANALTEGYGRRDLVLSAAMSGGQSAGVRIDRISRFEDPTLLGARRLAQAAGSAAATQAEFWNRMEKDIGLPGDPGALVSRLTRFESTLVTAGATPSSPNGLRGILDAAKGLAQTFGALSESIQARRMDADQGIASAVRKINTTLGNVLKLNTDIRKGLAAGQDVSALRDQRQTAIDSIADLVPLRQVEREGGAVALYTAGGATLLEGSRPARLGFVETETITPHMSIQAGTLSGLSIEGTPLTAGMSARLLGGGKLAALFTIRDESAVSAQTALDNLARDLAERFQTVVSDPTLPTGAPGLFTDAGSPAIPADETGLSARLSVNAAADPAQGGALWRLRDGLGAATPGDPGDSRLLNSFSDALSSARSPATGPFAPQKGSASELAARFLSQTSTQRLSAEGEQAFTTSREAELRAAELANGVDTDSELQSLLCLEKAYAANARVLQVVDGLMEKLLGI